MDPITVLPDELMGEIFRRLNFAGRLAASHVCASWRRIALSDRRLWAEYTVRAPRSRRKAKASPVSALLARLWTEYNGPCVRRVRDRADAGILSALLARSDPLPFCLDCKFDVPDAISELVIAHLARMEALSFGRCETDEALQRLLAQDIPMLKRFVANRRLHGDTPMQISTGWASAPRLERLILTCPCVWPANCAIATLRSYSGDVPEGPGLDLSLSQMFPNLEVVSLHRVTQASLPRLTPLPPLLTTLELRTEEYNAGLDCTALLHYCTTPPIRDLLIDWMRNAPSIFEMVKLFERRVDGPWRLSLSEGIIHLRAPLADPPTYHYFGVYMYLAFTTRMAEIVPFCGRLCDLEMRMAALLPLCASNSVLPALDSVSIIVIPHEDGDAARSLQRMPGIQAPVLRSLRLRLLTRLEPSWGTLLDGIVRAFHSPRLESIFLDTDHPTAVGTDEIAALSAHPARLEIRSFSGYPVQVFGKADFRKGRATRETGTGRDRA